MPVEPGRTSELLHNSPCGKQDRETHNKPEQQAADPLSITSVRALSTPSPETLSRRNERRIECRESCTDTVAVSHRRNRTPNEIHHWIIPCPLLERAGALLGMSVSGKCNTGKKVSGKQKTAGRALEATPEQRAELCATRGLLTLAPGGTQTTLAAKTSTLPADHKRTPRAARGPMAPETIASEKRLDSFLSYGQEKIA